MTELHTTPTDKSIVIKVALEGIGHARDRGELRAELAPLHPRYDTFPSEILLELAADAVELSGVSRDSPIAFDTLRDRYLPECAAHTRAQHYKSLFMLRAAPMIRAGVDPSLLEEVSHWRSDDAWTWALDALLVYLNLHARHVEEAHLRSVDEFDEQVDVAVRCEVVAQRRPEHREPTDTVPSTEVGDRAPVDADPGEELRILGGASSGASPALSPGLRLEDEISECVGQIWLVRSPGAGSRRCLRRSCSSPRVVR